MSSTISLKASDSFLIVMHQVSSAGESEKSLQRPELMNSSAITIPTLLKTHVQLAKAETVLTCHQQFH